MKRMNAFFYKTMVEKLGMWPNYTDEDVEMTYKIYNSITSDVEGLSKKDFHKIRKILEACNDKMKPLADILLI